MGRGNKQPLSCKGAVGQLYGSMSFPVGKPLCPVKTVTKNIRLEPLLSKPTHVQAGLSQHCSAHLFS